MLGLERVDVNMNPVTTVPGKNPLEYVEERTVVRVAKEVVAGARRRALDTLGCAFAAFPVVVVVVVQNRTAGNLRGQYERESEGEVARIGVDVDRDKESDLVVENNPG